jgi:hypothetical protein
MTKELSQKQKKFGREYMVDFNVADAYVRAGYSKNGAQSGGSRLLRDPRIQAYIAELEAEATERAGLTIDGVLKNLREDRDAARKAGQFGPAVRADELMGKHLAMFTDVTKQTVTEKKAPEEIIRESSIVNGVLNERALAAGLEWLRLLRAPMPPRNEEPTQPDPESGKPALEAVS